MNERDLLAAVARLTAENIRLDIENAKLRRYAGMARLLADMRADLTEFELSGDALPTIDIPALLRRQAE